MSGLPPGAGDLPGLIAGLDAAAAAYTDLRKQLYGSGKCPTKDQKDKLKMLGQQVDDLYNKIKSTPLADNLSLLWQNKYIPNPGSTEVGGGVGD
jgi:hypothetical protein